MSRVYNFSAGPAVMPEEVLSYADVRRQTTYIAFAYTLADAFRDHVAPKVGAEKAAALLDAACAELAKIDVSGGSRYAEKEVF